MSDFQCHCLVVIHLNILFFFYLPTLIFVKYYFICQNIVDLTISQDNSSNMLLQSVLYRANVLQSLVLKSDSTEFSNFLFESTWSSISFRIRLYQFQRYTFKPFCYKLISKRFPNHGTITQKGKQNI